jgi:D-aminoacyl-tRNA deacylase
MRLVIQRVLEARVIIHHQVYSQIGPGLLVLLGIHRDDTPTQIKWLINKLIHLRIFSDAEGKMNRDVKEIGGQVMVVSQFTLYGNYLNGRRPDFIQAAPPDLAEPLYNQFVVDLQKEIGEVQTGVFGAYMHISLINDGPVTMIIDGEKETQPPVAT